MRNLLVNVLNEHLIFSDNERELSIYQWSCGVCSDIKYGEFSESEIKECFEIFIEYFPRFSLKECDFKYS